MSDFNAYKNSQIAPQLDREGNNQIYLQSDPLLAVLIALSIARYSNPP
jgi:hypothetical protein